MYNEDERQIRVDKGKEIFFEEDYEAYAEKSYLCIMVEYISNLDHYNKVLSLAAGVKNSLWIGTADIKDLHVKMGSDSIPFLGVLAQLIKKGVDVRLIHAKEPGPAFREDFDRYPILIKRLDHRICPRVHFKMMIFDFTKVYVGSANLTGAGMGMKGAGSRNFECGILSDEDYLIDSAAQQFDDVWSGRLCASCRRKQFCSVPMIEK